MQIADGSVASFHYTLTGQDGAVIDHSTGREPMTYMHGAGFIVRGLEKAMAGHQAGDSFHVTVTPEEGYGPRHQELLQTVPKSAFQGTEPEPGMQFQASGPQGSTTVTVTVVNGDEVTVDGNHPLAGQTLDFDIEVLTVREATAEETQHGHVHGADGQTHD